MGAVVKAVAQPVKVVAKAAETVVKPIVKTVEKVGKAVEKTAQAVAKDPIPVLISVAAQAVGIPAPLTAAAITAAQGGSIEDIAKSAGAAYVGGKVAGQVGAAVKEAAPVVANVLPSAAQSATSAAITGRDVLSSALGGGIAGGVAGELAPTVGTDVARTAGQIAGATAAGTPIENAIASGVTGLALNQLSGAATDIAKAVTEGDKPPVTASTEFAPLASGGVMSDVSPTPLVRLPQREGTVSVTQAPQEFQGVGLGGELPQPSLADFEEAEYQEQLRQADIAQQRALPTQTQFQPIISPVDQQIFNMLTSSMGIRQGEPRATATTGTPAKTPAQTAQELATGFVSPRATETGAGTGRGTGGGTTPSGESMIGGMTGAPEATGGGMLGGEGGGTMAGTGGAGTGEGGTATPISESMMSPLNVRAPSETGTRTLARTLGLPQSDSALGAILGTSMAPTGEPIMGEDESQRRAVWNLESLRNALGI
jgi:hypothetical protein